jgi:hypothetical protein
MTTWWWVVWIVIMIISQPLGIIWMGRMVEKETTLVEIVADDRNVSLGSVH